MVWLTSDFVVLVFVARLDVGINLGLEAFPVESLVDKVSFFQDLNFFLSCSALRNVIDSGKLSLMLQSHLSMA